MSTTAAIMQPTYLPWLGYLDLLDQADVFVLLDTVQLDHRSWQHRNRIRTAQGLTWLTVPVASHDKRARLDQVRIGSSDEFPSRHLNLLREAYGDAPGWAEVQAATAGLQDPPALLVDLTIPIIERLAETVGIDTPVVRASTLVGGGSRGALLATLAAEVAADRYVSPPGSVTYLAEDRGEFEQRGIDVVVHRFEHPTYRQRHEPFEPYASCIDLLALAAPSEVLSAVRAGRRAAAPLDEALAEADA